MFLLALVLPVAWILDRPQCAPQEGRPVRADAVRPLLVALTERVLARL